MFSLTSPSHTNGIKIPVGYSMGHESYNFNHHGDISITGTTDKDFPNLFPPAIPISAISPTNFLPNGVASGSLQQTCSPNGSALICGFPIHATSNAPWQISALRRYDSSLTISPSTPNSPAKESTDAESLCRFSSISVKTQPICDVSPQKLETVDQMEIPTEFQYQYEANYKKVKTNRKGKKQEEYSIT